MGERLTAIALAVAALAPLPSAPARVEVGYRPGTAAAVAGIVAAAGDNHVGVAGYCGRCRVMPLKVLDANGGGFASDVARAVVWATDQGARVINASLGGPLEDSSLAAAAQYAAMRGAL